LLTDQVGRRFSRPAIVAAYVVIGGRCESHALRFARAKSILLQQCQVLVRIDDIVVDEADAPFASQSDQIDRTIAVALSEYHRRYEEIMLLKLAQQAQSARVEQVNDGT